jgi:hypothetical protein
VTCVKPDESSEDQVALRDAERERESEMGSGKEAQPPESRNEESIQFRLNHRPAAVEAAFDSAWPRRTGQSCHDVLALLKL